MSVLDLVGSGPRVECVTQIPATRLFDTILIRGADDRIPVIAGEGAADVVEHLQDPSPGLAAQHDQRRGAVGA